MKRMGVVGCGLMGSGIAQISALNGYTTVVVEVNDELQSAPRLLNTDPYGRGWLVRIAAEAWEVESAGLLRASPEVEAWVRRELSEHEDRR